MAVDTSNATIAVLDRRTGRRWQQTPVEAGMMVTGAQTEGNRIELDLWHVPSGLELKAVLELDAALPEFTFRVEGDGEMPGPLRYPCPFASAAGTA